MLLAKAMNPKESPKKPNRNCLHIMDLRWLGDRQNQFLELGQLKTEKGHLMPSIKHFIRGNLLKTSLIEKREYE